MKTICKQAYKIINKMINENQFIPDGTGELAVIKFLKISKTLSESIKQFQIYPSIHEI